MQKLVKILLSQKFIGKTYGTATYWGKPNTKRNLRRKFLNWRKYTHRFVSKYTKMKHLNEIQKEFQSDSQNKFITSEKFV